MKPNPKESTHKFDNQIKSMRKIGDHTITSIRQIHFSKISIDSKNKLLSPKIPQIIKKSSSHFNLFDSNRNSLKNSDPLISIKNKIHSKSKNAADDPPYQTNSNINKDNNVQNHPQMSFAWEYEDITEQNIEQNLISSQNQAHILNIKKPSQQKFLSKNNLMHNSQKEFTLSNKKTNNPKLNTSIDKKTNKNKMLINQNQKSTLQKPKTLCKINSSNCFVPFKQYLFKKSTKNSVRLNNQQEIGFQKQQEPNTNISFKINEKSQKYSYCEEIKNVYLNLVKNKSVKEKKAKSRSKELKANKISNSFKTREKSIDFSIIFKKCLFPKNVQNLTFNGLQKKRFTVGSAPKKMASCLFLDNFNQKKDFSKFKSKIANDILKSNSKKNLKLSKKSEYLENTPFFTEYVQSYNKNSKEIIRKNDKNDKNDKADWPFESSRDPNLFQEYKYSELFKKTDSENKKNKIDSIKIQKSELSIQKEILKDKNHKINNFQEKDFCQNHSNFGVIVEKKNLLMIKPVQIPKKKTILPRTLNKNKIVVQNNNRLLYLSSFSTWEEQFQPQISKNPSIIQLVASIKNIFIPYSQNSKNFEFKTTSKFYKIESKLMESAFGSVHIATQILTGLPVAIKSIDKNALKGNLKIHQEIFTLKKIKKNKYLINLLEVFESEDCLNLVLEYQSNGDLITFLNNRILLTEKELKPIFRKVVLAVKKLHQLSIIHRDIKMDNVLLDKNLDPVLTDFGISSIVQEGMPIHDTSGTPAYLAPEVIKSQGEICFKTDVWGLGVLLYTLIFGILPFQGNNFQELYGNILDGNFYFPAKKISSELQDLIKNMLKVDVKARVSVDQILRHRWFDEFCDINEEISENVHDKSGTNSRRICDVSVRFLNDIGFPMEYIFESISENKCNHALACFENIKSFFD